jgi:hypothetical protein
MKKSFLLLVLGFIFQSAVFSQDPNLQSQLPSVADQTIKEIEDFKKLIAQQRTEIDDIKQKIDSASNENEKEKEKKKLEEKKLEEKKSAIETAENVQKVMELTTDLINNTLSTANLFANVANAMRVVDSVEAKKIDKTTVKAEKIWNTAGDVVSIGGAVASTIILLNDKNKAKEAVIGVSLTSLANVIFKIVGKKKGAKNTIDYIYDKATQLSIHSFLLIKIRSVSDYMIDLENYNKNLIIRLKGSRAEIRFPANENDVAQIVRPEIGGLNVVDNWKDIEVLITTADDVLRLIYQVDHLYNVELSLLQKEMKERSSFKIYTEEGRKSLEGLEKSIQNARDSWKNVRYFYTKVETALATFRQEAPNILEKAKYKI